MSRKHRHLEASEHQKEIVRVTKRRLFLVAGSLAAVLAMLIFKIGGSFWPDWLMDYSRAFVALLGFLLISLSLLYPIIVEFYRAPGEKSGPGDLPGGYGGGAP